MSCRRQARLPARFLARVVLYYFLVHLTDERRPGEWMVKATAQDPPPVPKPTQVAKLSGSGLSDLPPVQAQHGTCTFPSKSGLPSSSPCQLIGPRRPRRGPLFFHHNGLRCNPRSGALQGIFSMDRRKSLIRIYLIDCIASGRSISLLLGTARN